MPSAYIWRLHLGRLHLVCPFFWERETGQMLRLYLTCPFPADFPFQPITIDLSLFFRPFSFASGGRKIEVRPNLARNKGQVRYGTTDRGQVGCRESGVGN
jgi:hypothetical protein